MSIELKQIVIVYDHDYAYIGEVTKAYKGNSVQIAYNNKVERFAANGRFYGDADRGYFESVAHLTTQEKHARAQAHNAQKLQAMAEKQQARAAWEAQNALRLEAAQKLVAAGKHHCIDTSAGQIHIFDIGEIVGIGGCTIMVKFRNEVNAETGKTKSWTVGTTETGTSIGGTSALGDTPEAAAAEIVAAWYVNPIR
jgi:hypothetical protein